MISTALRQCINDEGDYASETINDEPPSQLYRYTPTYSGTFYDRFRSDKYLIK